MAKAITELKKFFNGDKEASKALSLLQYKLNSHFDDGETEELESTEDFPVPRELLEKPESFAIFSDGACRGNPGPGAWGIMGQNSEGDVLFEKWGVDISTTNNRMELEGAIKGLEAMGDYLNKISLSHEVPIFLYSDSRYVVDGMTSWVVGWKKRGWKKADKKEPENLEQWQQLDAVSYNFLNLKFVWVRGHAGHAQNERCDEIANFALDQLDT